MMETLGKDLGYYLVTLPTKARFFLYAIPDVLSANLPLSTSPHQGSLLHERTLPIGGLIKPLIP